MMSEPSTSAFTVLFVCTANLCRSPMAEFLLRHRLPAGSGASRWSVGSAGVAAQDGGPMHPTAERVLHERGLDATAFDRRRLRPALLGAADLILTAETVHRSAAITMMPTIAARTFTVRQFARLCVDLDPIAEPTPEAAGRALLSGALSRRGHHELAGAKADDIPDPIGHRRARFSRCADLLDDAISTMLAPVIFPSG